jgi:riboflavin kinase/FMN adenylyltransferase
MKNRVVAMGDFDGVHRGHQAILRALTAWAKELDAEPIAISFDRNTKGRKKITAPQIKEYYLQECGIADLILLPFEEWKEVSAEAFAQAYLKEKLGAVGLLSGGDLHFGKGGAGNEFTLLSCGIAVKKIEDERLQGERISSSEIRVLLEQGDLAGAQEAMGHPFELMGEVCHGKGLARNFGLPTINLPLAEDQLLPPLGLYAARVQGKGKEWGAVANIGLRPTTDQAQSPNLEAHLLDCDEDLYGQTLKVSLVEFLRPEQPFEDENQLFLQIEKDKEKSEEVLKDV